MKYNYFTISIFLFLSFESTLLSEDPVKKESNYEQNLSQVEKHCNCKTDESLKEAEKKPRKNYKKKQRMGLSRTDQIPRGRLEEESASYLEGYIQALIDANYHELNVIVYVDHSQVVHLYNLPNNDRIRQSIIAFVSDLPDVNQVKPGVISPEVKIKLIEKQLFRRVKGVWFPESTLLFTPLIANPRDPIYSVAYRWGDKVLAKSQIAVSLGDIFPIFRWFDVFPAHGDFQIDIGACVWANFDMNPLMHPSGEWAELVTTDYLVSVPFTYAFDKWAFRFRPYHISSHLGDEFMVNQPWVPRVNPSFEAIDFFTSYQATSGLRIYVGPGVIVNSDDSFPMKYFYVGYGVEWRFAGYRYHYHRLYGSPFFAADIQQWQVNNYRPSATLQLGYEWSKLQGAGRKVRLFGEYHNGYSEGQFFDQISKYFAIRAAWGF